MVEWSWQPEGSGLSVRMQRANGIDFELVEGGSGDRLALMLHGFPELNYSWRHQIPMLIARGWRVWAPNLRGYGLSSRPPAVRDYALDRLTADVIALIAASGAREVMLIAHDWGAIIAWCVAITRPDLLDRLVIMNVPHPLIGRRELRHWHQRRKSWYMFFFQLPALPEVLLRAGHARAIGRAFTGSAVHPERFTGADLAIYRRAAMRPGATQAMLDYYRALFRHRDTVDFGDGRVDVPVLVVWGEQDIAISIRALDGLDAYVPDLTVRRLPDASHWVQQDAPEAVNAALAAWLDRSGF